jgi:hypothetical protein
MFNSFLIKWLRKEIERRLDLVGRIKHEPKLVSEASSADTHNPETLCRMQAMDDIKILGAVIFTINLHLSYYTF